MNYFLFWLKFQSRLKHPLFKTGCFNRYFLNSQAISILDKLLNNTSGILTDNSGYVACRTNVMAFQKICFTGEFGGKKSWQI